MLTEKAAESDKISWINEVIKELVFLQSTATNYCYTFTIKIFLRFSNHKVLKVENILTERKEISKAGF